MEVIQYYSWSKKLIKKLCAAHNVDEETLCNGVCQKSLLRDFLCGKKDMGEYEKSNEWNRILMEVSVKSHRMFSFASLIYEQWWNANEKQVASGGKPIVDLERMLCCALISNFRKQEVNEKFYRSKFEAMKVIECGTTISPSMGSSDSTEEESA